MPDHLHHFSRPGSLYRDGRGNWHDNFGRYRDRRGYWHYASDEDANKVHPFDAVLNQVVDAYEKAPDDKAGGLVKVDYDPTFDHHGLVWLPFHLIVNVATAVGTVVGTALSGAGHTVADAARDVVGANPAPPPPEQPPVQIK